jgi:hypothetical protein
MLSVAVQSVILLSAILHSVIMLGVVILCHYSEFLFAHHNALNYDTPQNPYFYAECSYVEHHYIKCHYAV